MKRLSIEGTVDIIGTSVKRPAGKVYSEMTFLTRAGDEIFLRNVSVDPALDALLDPGVSGHFEIDKSLFSNHLHTIRIGAFA